MVDTSTVHSTITLLLFSNNSLAVTDAVIWAYMERSEVSVCIGFKGTPTMMSEPISEIASPILCFTYIHCTWDKFQHIPRSYHKQLHCHILTEGTSLLYKRAKQNVTLKHLIGLEANMEVIFLVPWYFSGSDSGRWERDVQNLDLVHGQFCHSSSNAACEKIYRGPGIWNWAHVLYCRHTNSTIVTGRASHGDSE